MRRSRQTKIIATLGPSSSDTEGIESLYLKGADIFRLNLSHGTHESHAQAHRIIKSLEKKYNTSIGILLDLQGPKLRIGDFVDEEIHISKGQKFSLDLDSKLGSVDRVSLPHPEIFQALKEGDLLLLDDGKLQLRVMSSDATHAQTVVEVGGPLSAHKGINLPNIHLPMGALTSKDEADINFGLSLGVDYIGLSFVQSVEDIKKAKTLINGQARVLAKIEKPMALNNLNQIIEEADGLLVARGDLGVELKLEQVPMAQKHIVHLSQTMGKPVIVATQMLESMILNPTPTRAEVSDVANAVYEGADGVMLSAESASGKHPVESVEMMDRIIKAVERDPSYKKELTFNSPTPEATKSDAITGSAVKAAQTIGAVAIVSFTASGWTSQRISRQRPPIPIVGITPDRKVARELCFCWGVQPVVSQNIKTYPEMVKKAPEIAQEMELAQTGDLIVLTAGDPLGIAGGTNVLRIVEVK